jgi:hypothetical protein
MFNKMMQGIRSIDSAYSAKIGNMYKDAHPAVQTAAYTVGGATPSFQKIDIDRVYGPETMPQRVGREVMEYAIPAANAVPKYVLPAAGVTLAGSALIDLASQIGQQTQSAIMPE